MSLTAATVRTAWALIKARLPDAVVRVQGSGGDCEGMLAPEEAQAVGGDFGEEGFVTGAVKVDMSEYAEPNAGETLYINGVACTAIGVRPDPLRALMVISYQELQEAEIT